MKITLSILGLAAAAALAGPAAAEDIHINLAGKSPAAVRAEIQKAADRVCNLEHIAGTISLQELSTCSRFAAEDALAQAKGYEARSAQASAQVGPVASNAPADHSR